MRVDERFQLHSQEVKQLFPLALHESLWQCNLVHVHCLLLRQMELDSECGMTLMSTLKFVQAREY